MKAHRIIANFIWCLLHAQMFNQLKGEIKSSKKNHEILRRENGILKERCTKNDETIGGLLSQVDAATNKVRNVNPDI